jgi:large subunit ribosomal protein L30
MASLLVVNLHGLINTTGSVRSALVELGIGKRFSATVLPDDQVTRGTLKHCKDHVAWAPVDAELLAALLKAKGRVSNAKPLDEKALKELGFKDHAELAAKITKEGVRLASITGVKPFMGLAPPKGGFKRSSRRPFNQGGILGENPKLPELVRRML